MANFETFETNEERLQALSEARTPINTLEADLRANVTRTTYQNLTGAAKLAFNKTMVVKSMPTILPVELNTENMEPHEFKEMLETISAQIQSCIENANISVKPKASEEEKEEEDPENIKQEDDKFQFVKKHKAARPSSIPMFSFPPTLTANKFSVLATEDEKTSKQKPSTSSSISTAHNGTYANTAINDDDDTTPLIGGTTSYAAHGVDRSNAWAKPNIPDITKAQACIYAEEIRQFLTQSPLTLPTAQFLAETLDDGSCEKIKQLIIFPRQHFKPKNQAEYKEVHNLYLKLKENNDYKKFIAKTRITELRKIIGSYAQTPEWVKQLPHFDNIEQLIINYEQSADNLNDTQVQHILDFNNKLILTPEFQSYQTLKTVEEIKKYLELYANSTESIPAWFDQLLNPYTSISSIILAPGNTLVLSKEQCNAIRSFHEKLSNNREYKKYQQYLIDKKNSTLAAATHLLIYKKQTRRIDAKIILQEIRKFKQQPSANYQNDWFSALNQQDYAAIYALINDSKEFKKPLTDEQILQAEKLHNALNTGVSQAEYKQFKALCNAQKSIQKMRAFSKELTKFSDSVNPLDALLADPKYASIANLIKTPSASIKALTPQQVALIGELHTALEDYKTYQNFTRQRKINALTESDPQEAPFNLVFNYLSQNRNDYPELYQFIENEGDIFNLSPILSEQLTQLMHKLAQEPETQDILKEVLRDQNAKDAKTRLKKQAIFIGVGGALIYFFADMNAQGVKEKWKRFVEKDIPDGLLEFLKWDSIAINAFFNSAVFEHCAVIIIDLIKEMQEIDKNPVLSANQKAQRKEKIKAGGWFALKLFASQLAALGYFVQSAELWHEKAYFKFVTALFNAAATEFDGMFGLVQFLKKFHKKDEDDMSEQPAPQKNVVPPEAEGMYRFMPQFLKDYINKPPKQEHEYADIIKGIKFLKENSLKDVTEIFNGNPKVFSALLLSIVHHPNPQTLFEDKEFADNFSKITLELLAKGNILKETWWAKVQSAYEYQVIPNLSLKNVFFSLIWSAAMFALSAVAAQIMGLPNTPVASLITGFAALTAFGLSFKFAYNFFFGDKNGFSRSGMFYTAVSLFTAFTSGSGLNPVNAVLNFIEILVDKFGVLSPEARIVIGIAAGIFFSTGGINGSAGFGEIESLFLDLNRVGAWEWLKSWVVKSKMPNSDVEKGDTAPKPIDALDETITLKCLSSLINICENAKNPSLRHKLQEMQSHITLEKATANASKPQNGFQQNGTAPTKGLQQEAYCLVM